MTTPYDRNKAVIEEFRANAGRVGGPFTGKTLLLLHTIGARSGLERVHPVAYVIDDDRFVIVASKGGAPTNPAWYHNIVAHPHISVEVGVDRVPVVASVASEPERSRLYDQMIAMLPVFADYRQRTSRIIPVITLRREKV
jgi:deazaflavin-dependent oxidoreductase (nitroreductase family)